MATLIESAGRRTLKDLDGDATQIEKVDEQTVVGVVAAMSHALRIGWLPPYTYFMQRSPRFLLRSRRRDRTIFQQSLPNVKPAILLSSESADRQADTALMHRLTARAIVLRA